MKVEHGKNGEPCVSELIDIEDTRTIDSQRLLDPSATPKKLKQFAFGVGCPCPTRTMTRETAIALRQLSYPMFGNPIHYSPDSLEVGEARNTIVRQALEDGVKWLFFLDYDVAPPPNALITLLKLNVDIAAGVYHSKSVPSWPLILVKGWDYAFEDYEFGDLIKAQGVGMGCTLINMEVFKKIKEPWFKTVPGYSENSNSILPMLTEDIYFCEKALKAGFDITVDTSVQCGHVDWRSGMIFSGQVDAKNPKKINPSWTYRNQDGKYMTEFVADANHPNRRWAKVDPPPQKKDTKCIDLGSGTNPFEDYTGIDLFCEGENVLKGDCKDLSWYRKKHGFVSKLRASHLLEHFSHREIPRVFREWINTVKPGGEVHIRVPDLMWAMKQIEKAAKSGEDQGAKTDYWIAMIYGYQHWDGQDHRTGFTKHRLEQLAKSSGLVDVKVITQLNKGNKEETIAPNQELILTGKRG